MAYSRNYDIPYFLIDQNRKLRTTALMQFLEDMAIRHSETCGVGLDFYQQNERAWVLKKWDVEIDDYPHFNRQITIKTIPTSFRRFFGYRKFEVLDEYGTLLARAGSLWVFVDTKEKRPVPVTDEVMHAYGLSREQNDPLQIEPPEAPESDTFAIPIKIRPGDIDTNHHVNNIRFIEWALDTLPPGFAAGRLVNRVLVDYRMELTYGDGVLCEADQVENGEHSITRHRLKSGDKTACVATFHWT